MGAKLYGTGASGTAQAKLVIFSFCCSCLSFLCSSCIEVMGQLLLLQQARLQQHGQSSCPPSSSKLYSFCLCILFLYMSE